MANEAVIRDRLENPIDMDTENSATLAFEKGAFVKLVDARAVSGAALIAAAPAGIIARESISGSSRPRVAVFRRGIFDVHASGAVPAGAHVVLAENNDVMSGAAANLNHRLGVALETAADDETFQIELNI